VSNNLNKVFESIIRLRIMSILMVNEHYDFNAFKDILGLTDGNLASHLKTLEREEYINVTKSFVGRKPRTSYRITNVGEIAFKAHLQALENLIQDSIP
jgi:DNA-binding HxlR family transcriptional regulator